MSDIDTKLALCKLSNKHAEALYWTCMGKSRKDTRKQMGGIADKTLGDHMTEIYDAFGYDPNEHWTTKRPRLKAQASKVLFQYVKKVNDLSRWDVIKELIKNDIDDELAERKREALDEDNLVDEPAPDGLWRTPQQKADDKLRRIEARQQHEKNQRLLQEKETEVKDLKERLNNLRQQRVKSDPNKEVIKNLEERISSLEAELEEKTLIAEREETEPLKPHPKPHIEPENIYALDPEERVNLIMLRKLNYYEYVSYQEEIGKIPRTFDKWLDSATRVPLEEYFEIQQGNIETPDIDTEEKPQDMTASEFEELEEYKRGIQKWYENELEARSKTLDETPDEIIDEPESPPVSYTHLTLPTILLV